jgi:hypothetical protein
LSTTITQKLLSGRAGPLSAGTRKNPKSSEDSRRKASSIADRMEIRTEAEVTPLLAEERPLQTVEILVEAVIRAEDIPAGATPAEAEEDILVEVIPAEEAPVAVEEETQAVDILAGVAAPAVEAEVPAEVVAVIQVEEAVHPAAVDRVEEAAGAAATN